MKNLMSGVAFAAAVMFAAPSFAEVQNTEAPQMTVRYADLDLSNDRDAARLLRRMNHAAAFVCRDHRPPPGSLRYTGRDYAGEREAFENCRTEALSQAVAQFDHPMVTAMHINRGGSLPGETRFASLQR